MGPYRHVRDHRPAPLAAPPAVPEPDGPGVHEGMKGQDGDALVRTPSPSGGRGDVHAELAAEPDRLVDAAAAPGALVELLEAGDVGREPPQHRGGPREVLAPVQADPVPGVERHRPQGHLSHGTAPRFRRA
jgi:hypothetical protein